MGNDLQRLAQAHVVGKNPSEAHALQGPEPPEAVLLIPPQLRLKARRHLDVRIGIRVEVANKLPEPGVADQANALGILQQSIHKKGAGAREPDAARGKLVDIDAETIRERGGRLQVLPDAHDVAGREAHITLLPFKALEIIHKLTLGEPACPQLNVKKPASDLRTHRKVRGGAHHDSAQLLGKKDLAELSQLREPIGEQPKQQLIVGVIEGVRPADEREVVLEDVNGVVLRREVARGLAGHRVAGTERYGPIPIGDLSLA